MAEKCDIKIAEFREMRVNKEKAVAQVRRYSNGCTRSYLGRIVTKEEFEDKKKRILGRQVRS